MGGATAALSYPVGAATHPAAAGAWCAAAGAPSGYPGYPPGTGYYPPGWALYPGYPFPGMAVTAPPGGALGRALLQWVGAAVAAAAAETATTVQSDLDAAPRPLGPAEAPAGGKRARKETGIKIRQRRRRKNGIGERRRIQSGA